MLDKGSCTCGQRVFLDGSTSTTEPTHTNHKLAGQRPLDTQQGDATTAHACIATSEVRKELSERDSPAQLSPLQLPSMDH